jgi:hypothetical protein
MPNDEDDPARLPAPEGLLEGPPVEGETHIFSLKLESWMEDMAADLAPKGAPRPAAGQVAQPGPPPETPPHPLPREGLGTEESGERRSAVPPIPGLAASAVPPIPALAAPVKSGRRGVAVIAVLVALLAAGGAGWLLFGAEIRARLPV